MCIERFALCFTSVILQSDSALLFTKWFVVVGQYRVARGGRGRPSDRAAVPLFAAWVCRASPGRLMHD